MQEGKYKVQDKTPFSESLIWELNREYYQSAGIDAWSHNVVPHHMTSNSMVGKTYAELIFATLKDLSLKGKTKEIVYILELGAGHGRLAYHILIHLEELVKINTIKLPPYCYILSDIVEKNLSFFSEHSQLKRFYDKGNLDLAYFDAVGGKELILRHAEKTVNPGDLSQPIIAIANYFFDSIPNELYHIKNKNISLCSISIESKVDPSKLDPHEILSNLEFTYYDSPNELTKDNNLIARDILQKYKDLLTDTYLFFPKFALDCIQNLQNISKSGLILLTMDKGFHELHNLENKKKPEIITHGSFSLWVNFRIFI